ncbi:hypothetical protein AB17_4622 [Escherichia coli 3-105-05_S1_C1]|nr:hypothetical protein AB17_4622 [Escherichia coli 3-105-05_S1_C1]
MSPAPAGINRRSGGLTLNKPCVPRASGDKPRDAGGRFVFLLCSPRQRG